MSINKIAIFITGGLLILSLLIAGIFVIKGFPDVYKSEALILVEQSKISPNPELDDHKITYLLVKKAERKMFLYEGKSLVKTYKIALGFNPKGTKLKQGDGATPEGEYYITHKNEKSKFYLSLGVSFPNRTDAESGLQRKLISQIEYEQIIKADVYRKKTPQNTKLGGDIFLHGGGTSSDWTWGCVALSHEDIKELFDLLPLKTPIKITP